MQITEENIDSLISEVRRIVVENPEVIYPHPKCLYHGVQVGNGEGCLLGQAAQNVLPELFEEMKECDLTRGSPLFNCLPSVKLVYDYTAKSSLTQKIYFLQLVQTRQDQKTLTWRECWNEALTRLSLDFNSSPELTPITEVDNVF